MTKNVRVRFAPSPTGPLHIGGVRTALFNYLFAKKHNGTFVLRVEDTDQNRYVEGAENYIVESLNWCGIPFDEGPGKNEKFPPYRQSERKHLYKQYADELINNGKAYYAFDTTEELDEHRKEHEANGKTFIYNWHNREKLTNSISLPKEDVEKRIANSDDYVIRFWSPKDKTLDLKDIIRGDIQIDTNVLDDKVLFKSDGMPTYHLANIVDDHLMEITHVIRGEEWLPSLALHFQLYDAFGWEAPEFAHLPLILKPTGKGKLSKRDGDKLGFPVFPLEWKDPKSGEVSRGYKEDGYFPEAMVNFLAFLGWNPGTTQELFNLDELVESFSLNRVAKAGAKFDPDKTKWFQQQYLRNTENTVLAEMLDTVLGNKYSLDKLTTVCGLMKERATFVEDIWTEGSFLLERPTEFDEQTINKKWKDESEALMLEWSTVLGSIDIFNAEKIETTFKSFLTEKDLSIGAVLPLFRLLLTGKGMGPSMFEISEFLGKEECIARISVGISLLQKV